MSIADDKRELLKLKQGIIEESETIKEEKIEYEKPVGKARVSNFFYHHKIKLIVLSFVMIFCAIMIYDVATKAVEDVRVMLITSTLDTYLGTFEKKSEIEDALSRFTPNFDENKYSFCEVYDINIFSTDTTDPNVYIANQTKLFAEMQTNTSQILIGNKEMFYRLGGEADDESNEDLFLPSTYLLDLSELFPSSDKIEENYFFKVKGSEFSRLAGLEEVDDLYIALRGPYDDDKSSKKVREARDRSLIVMTNIVNDEVHDGIIKSDIKK